MDGADYKIIKSESERKIEILEAKLSEVIGNQNAFIDIVLLVNNAVNRLMLLDTIYCQSANCDKRELIGSMYPQNSLLKTCNIEPLKQAIYTLLFT